MNIAWFIFITFVIAGIQAYIYGKWGLARIQYTRSFNEKAVFEGERIEMIDEISNRKLLPVPWLRLESKISADLQFQRQSDLDNEIDSGDFHRTLFSLMPYQKVKRRQHLTCTKRGFYQFQTVSLSTGDVLGIGETFKSVPSPAEIIVYPPLLPMKDIPLPAHSWLGDIIVRRWIIEDPFLTSGVRDYSYGDPLNSVNWKATARTNRLQVSKRDFSADHHLMIYINFNQNEDIWRPIIDEPLLEKALTYAASIAQYAIANGISTGFGCNAYFDEMKKEPIRIEPENSKQQLAHLFETMAKVKIGTSTFFDYFLRDDVERKMQGTDILLITSIVTIKMKEMIKKLEAEGNSVEVLMLESEFAHQKAN
ncbi:DUF58 domain-containing protein [Lederbergia citrea]|uniref:DUF58 domain-containing protein n=1 Tax=Lederbergia citrea TaxID=2833581 RepID=A0A942UQL0_9BACI|nr:DUF58 domain-containing protein [Lederbergia citrea]MBS4223241.1 DUF58 domain-containing protein [Lederbergia citrea]